MFNNKKFKSSLAWVRHYLPLKGREWVRGQYDNHIEEVQSDPCLRETFNKYIWMELRKINAVSESEIGDYPEKKTSMYKKIDGSNQELTTNSPNIKTIEDLLEYAEVDTTEWKVKSYEINSWEVTMGKKSTSSGDPETYTNFQVKAKLEKRNSEIAIKNLLDDFKKEIKNHSFKYSPIKRKQYKDGVMIEISLYDIHYGLLAWGDETLDKDYDIKIARKLIKDSTDYLLSTASSQFNVEQIVFPIGNDFFNVNSALNTTFKGTPQSEDDRWKKSFSNAWKTVVEVVEMMTQVANTKIIIIPGNHDYEKAYYLGEVLYAWFKDSKNVNVDNTPATKKYHRYGNNFIGYLHKFRKTKMSELPILFSDIAPKDWAETKYHEIHTGHLHADRLTSVRSHKILTLPSLVAQSEWASEEGYDHLNEAQCHVYTRENGKHSVIHYYPTEEMYQS